MSYPLFLTLYLFAALVISTVFYEVLFLESIRKQLPAKGNGCSGRRLPITSLEVLRM